MCASRWDSAKPEGAVKSKAAGPARVARPEFKGGWARPHLRRCSALPGRLVLLARRGAPRAYTLGPERW
jgi:hypothetical protein